MVDIGSGVLGLGGILTMMLVLWLGSVLLRDASLVDRLWGMGFVLLAWLYLQPAGGFRGAPWLARLVVILVTIWGLRLSLYLTWRNWGQGEDYRYRAMRAAQGGTFWWKSLFSVFVLQGILAWIISAPLLVAVSSRIATPNSVWVGVGMACWLTGFLFETVGDWQLARFKANPSNRGQVMDRGLWRYTRHPNYFGDAVVWWGYFCLAAAVGGWWTAFGPALMTVLLMKVSGVALLEKTLQETKPQYRDYIRRTSAFVPRWPRAS